MRLKNREIKSVKDFVCKNTGMSEEMLMHDDTVYEIKDLNKASYMLKKAIKRGETIYIVGDYDVDGICSSAILSFLLKDLGGDIVVRLPRRLSEGYGMNVKMIDEFEAGFVLTVDNGITAFDAIEAAKAKGMDVLVMDHHLPARDASTGLITLPDADLIIDPNALADTADFNGYCGSGLAYKLAKLMLDEDDPVLCKCLSFAGLATVADSVPLVYENRRIVKEGLKSLMTRKGTTSGLRALLSFMDADRNIDEDTIGYKIAPALNAAGRLLDEGAKVSFDLLTFDGDEDTATVMAQQQAALNDTRKTLCASATAQVEAIIADNGMEDDFPLIIYAPGMHEGVVGIVAGQIAEKYQTPCILFTESSKKGLLKGSGRANGMCDLKSMLDDCREYLHTYGGHAQAAGLSVYEKDLKSFRKAAKADLLPDRKRLGERDTEYRYDLYMPENKANETLSEINRFAPYGEGNPRPTVCTEISLIPMYNKYYKLISNKGVKFKSANLEAVSFDNAKGYLDMGSPKKLKVAGELSLNEFMGRSTLQLKIDDMEPIKEEIKNESPLAKRLAERAAMRSGR